MELPLISQTIQNSGAITGRVVVGLVNYADDKSSQSAEGKKDQSANEDRVTISPEAKEKAFRAGSASDAQETRPENEEENLDQQELAQLQQLKRRDMEVRAHEQAHLSAAGQYARGSASFTYQKGPDGVSYAVGGEVGIDIAKESTPAATITKMQTIKRAALAPANPSSADKRIAARASATEAQARQELLQVQQEELLRSEEGDLSLSKSDAAGKSTPSDKPDTTTSPYGASTDAPTYGSLKTKFAAYEKMAAQ
jgi:hypothetical protein